MNKKFLIGIIVVLGVIVSLIVAKVFLDFADKNTEIPINAKDWDEQIYTMRTNYIGDNSKVSKIVNSLKFPEELKYSGIELQTSDDLPKSLNIIFSSSNENQETTKNIKSNFSYNSMIILSLIENCDKVEMSINKNGALYPIESRQRQWATELIGKDPFEFTATLEDFKEYIKKIDSIDFNEVQTYTPNLEESISNAILSHNKDKVYNGEFAAQGHITLGTEVDGINTTVYVYMTYMQFQFQNGIFEECAEMNSPAVITFTKDEYGNYKLSNFAETKDGSLYEVSLQELFPDDIIDMIKLYNSNTKQQENVNNQIVSSAKEYLIEIGREDAKIALSYQEKNYPPLSAQNSEIYDILYKAYADFPYYVGTLEKLENHIRYEYKTSYEKQDLSDIFSYTKTNMNTGDIEEYVKVQISGGEIKALEGEIRDTFYEFKKSYDADRQAAQGYNN
ncbi:hypothetical protein HMPREF9628_00363 [Peptoanaerobacter stomatis]|uniref:DUF4825 domain-containing protein n=1 Tax=Peptoanaerobacter stomatis TaxID=796937 RepID=G9XE19_9FIRM|nr:DUF4825 domain-containing protein [Peptoanaerobacter stomatis]EHL18677.1 hypothetical protein HMPREF9628_00363 [Peptoanaerobacter stomatis]